MDLAPFWVCRPHVYIFACDRFVKQIKHILLKIFSRLPGKGSKVPSHAADPWVSPTTGTNLHPQRMSAWTWVGPSKTQQIHRCFLMLLHWFMVIDIYIHWKILHGTWAKWNQHDLPSLYLCPFGLRRQNQYDGSEEFWVIVKECGKRQESLSYEEVHEKTGKASYLPVIFSA